MMTLKEILLDYQNKHLALPAFNIDTFEIYQAVESAVRETLLPCIVQLSPNEDSFVQAERLLLLVKKANLENLPIFLNMDHGKDLKRLLHLTKLGFDMVHFDGSKLAYAENLKISTVFISDLKKINPNIVVEAEFNQINLIDNGVDPKCLTDPSQALEFITQTKADLLAVSIGNLHGVNSVIPESIDLELLQNISSAVKPVYLTLHGGSGINSDQISSAINLGIVKININTDLRLQFKNSLARVLTEVNSEKLYEYLDPVILDLKKVIISKLQQFTNHV